MWVSRGAPGSAAGERESLEIKSHGERRFWGMLSGGFLECRAASKQQSYLSRIINQLQRSKILLLVGETLTFPTHGCVFPPPVILLTSLHQRFMKILFLHVADVISPH